MIYASELAWRGEDTKRMEKDYQLVGNAYADLGWKMAIERPIVKEVRIMHIFWKIPTDAQKECSKTMYIAGCTLRQAAHSDRNI